MSQKATSKTAKKASTQSTSARKTPAKKIASKKSTPKKMTMAEMQSSLKSLETRMKRADTLTRKSVTTLEEVVSTLDSRTKRDRADHRSALSRRVGKISNTFEENMAATREGIKSTLSQALAQHDIPSLQQSITDALSSLDHLETKQAKSIAKINRHLANLAKAVEDRIVKDQIAATEALHKVETELSSKLESIETDTANAISTIGDKVETLSDAMDKRNQKIETLVAQKISNLAARTQAQFDKKTNSMQERLDKLEQAEREAALTRPDALSESMSSHVSALAGQVETLKARLASIDASFDALQNQTQMIGQHVHQLKDPSAPNNTNNIVPFSGSVPTPVPSPVAPIHAPSQPSTVYEEAPSIASNPYQSHNASPSGNMAATSQLNQQSHIPVEFDPSSFNTQTATALAPQPYLETTTHQEMLAPPIMPPIMESAPSLTPPQIHNAELEEFRPPLSDTPPASFGNVDVDTLPVGAPQLPYEDPAYAETSMRIGGETDKSSKSLLGKLSKKSKKVTPVVETETAKTPLLTKRNLRVGALATGLTLVGLFAAKSFMSPNTSFENANNGAVSPVSTETINQPIGVYADNASPLVDAEQASTLETAATSGNAIAEYQLGITYMEQGRIDEGLTLIRNASATMPAAQYRLAKIYETGTGVEKDTALARELTERAARAGNRIAMHDLAIYYAYGNGDVEVDMNMAAGWFTKAAERGVVDSQFNLAILYENGQGVTPSPSDAYFWYSIAAAQGDQSANARIAALETTMTPEDIAATKTRINNFQLIKINPATNGIFNDLPWAKTNAQSPESQRIQSVQTMLGNVGFDVGTPDGLMGKRTRQAIRDFERINGLPETGQINNALIDRLSVASGA